MSEEHEYVVAIAQYGSINKAAKAMNISQPGLSQRLKRLEAELEAELFDRDSSPIRLTQAGEVYLRYALQAVAAEETMRRDVFSATNGTRQSLRVAVSMSRATSLLAEPIMSFYESHTACTLEFTEMEDLDSLHKLFLSDGIDCAILTPLVPDLSSYLVESLWKERLVVAASDRLHAPQLARARTTGSVSMRELEGIPFVLPTCGRYLDPLVERAVDSTNLRLDVVVKGCSTNMALDLMEDGLGVCVVPSTALLGRDHILSYELEDMRAEIDLKYIRRRDEKPSKEERLFISIVRKWLSLMKKSSAR